MKFNYITASVSPTEVCNLILTPPEDDPYDAIQAQLIKRTAESEQ